MPCNRLRYTLAGIFLVLASHLIHAQSVVYQNDFESGDVSHWKTTVRDPTWQNRIGISITPNRRQRLLGEFGNQRVRLNLLALPPHDSISVSFDLIIIGSWDGNNRQYGPDTWECGVDTAQLIRTTFSNTSFKQAYPESYPDNSNAAKDGALLVNKLGYTWTLPNLYSGPMDALYRITRTIAHTARSAQIAFAASLVDPGEGMDNESWALDNLVIAVSKANANVEPPSSTTTVPLPAGPSTGE